MNDLPTTQSDQADGGLDAALSALRSDPDIWQLPFDLAAQRLLDIALSCGCADRAELWQLEQSNTQLRLRCLRAGDTQPLSPTIGALREQGDNSDYFAALAGC